MRAIARFSLTGLLIGLAVAPPVHAAERLLTFLFGPGSPEAARQGARAAAATARHWLRSPGAEVELRHAGSPEAQSIDARMDAKKLEQAFAEAALQGRDADPATFLTALDAAAQATALHAGTRVLVALLNSPPLSSEAERTLQDLVELCRGKAVRVVVLDIGESGPNDPKSALQALATETGGMWLRQGKALEQNVVTAASGVQVQEERAVTPPASPGSGVAPSTGEAAGAGMQFEIPVHTRFIRTAMTATMSVGSVGHLTDSDSGTATINQIESPYDANESTGPMRGLILVESPLSALKFEVDNNTGSYLARARILSTVRNSKGVAVWSGQKEVNIRGPVHRLSTRRLGSLLFLRGLTLPAGEVYTLEAKVEDLLAGSAGTIHTLLRTGRGAPGLMASDALFVRPFSGSADRFEADQVLSYEGEALSPMLSPVFRAEEQINAQLYLVLYPGAPPALSLELSRDGRVVTRAPMQFKTQLRNLALEGKFGTLAGKGNSMYGGRAREFPYLADIKGAKLSPGNYEAVIYIGQDWPRPQCNHAKCAVPGHWGQTCGRANRRWTERRSGHATRSRKRGRGAAGGRARHCRFERAGNGRR